jgi:hypothetical protein
LKKSLQEIDHIISELQMYIYVAMKNCEDSADNLTQNESTAIQIYTMDWDSMHALNKLPSYKGTV